jgi:hypothetical protein
MRIPFIHILITALMVFLIFNYDFKKSINSSTIKISTLKNDEKYIYLKINLNSLAYIDSIGIKTNNINENIIVFENKTKKVTLDYYIDKNNILDNIISFRIYNNGGYKEYIKKLN